MSDTPTPRTEALIAATIHLSADEQILVLRHGMRDLERELAAANAALAEAQTNLTDYSEANHRQIGVIQGQREEIATRTQTEAALREQVAELHHSLRACVAQLRHEIVLAKLHERPNGMLTPDLIQLADQALALTPEIIASELAELREKVTAWSERARLLKSDLCDDELNLHRFFNEIIDQARKDAK